MTVAYRPENEAQVVEIVRQTLANEDSLSISGHGTKTGFGYRHHTSHKVCMQSCRGIINYEPSELIMKTLPGTSITEIDQVLAAHRQQLAFEPPALGQRYGNVDAPGTIGGIFMGNLSGPRRFRSGAARDHILGVKAVSGRGESYKSGGNVIKNVTGYDMSKLLCGSWGTLSILTEVTFKVLPAPDAATTICIPGLKTLDALNLLRMIAQSKLEASGLACLPANIIQHVTPLQVLESSAAVALVRIEGALVSVRERIDGLQRLLPGSTEITIIEDEQSALLWQLIRDVSIFPSDQSLIVKISIAPTETINIIEAITTMGDWYADAGGGWLWLNITCENPVEQIQHLRRQIKNGSVIIYCAPEAIKQAAGIYSQMPDNLYALNQRLKDSFDPKNILNPKRLYHDT